jgi:transposase-like protein
LVEKSGGQIAKEPGIYDSSLGNWVRRAREETAGAPTAEERAEIRELKRELEWVTWGRDILGRATAYVLGTRWLVSNGCRWAVGGGR